MMRVFPGKATVVKTKEQPRLSLVFYVWPHPLPLPWEGFFGGSDALASPYPNLPAWLVLYRRGHPGPARVKAVSISSLRSGIPPGPSLLSALA
ncbi:MAG: hypothetical protein ACYC2T_10455 [Bacillota bacterium]